MVRVRSLSTFQQSNVLNMANSGNSRNQPPVYEGDAPPDYSPGQPPSYTTAIRQPAFVTVDEQGRRAVHLVPGYRIPAEQLRQVHRTAGRQRTIWIEDDEDAVEVPSEPAAAPRRQRSRHVHFANAPSYIPYDPRRATHAAQATTNQALSEFFNDHGGAAAAPFLQRANHHLAASVFEQARAINALSGVQAAAPQLSLTPYQDTFGPGLTDALNAIDGESELPQTPPPQTEGDPETPVLQDARHAHGLRRSNAIRGRPATPVAEATRYRRGPDGVWYPVPAGQGGMLLPPSTPRRPLRRRTQQDEHEGSPSQGAQQRAADRVFRGRVRKSSDDADQPSKNTRSKRRSK